MVGVCVVTSWTFTVLTDDEHSSSAEAEVISVAWECVMAIDHLGPEKENFTVLERVKPSRDGSLKAAVIMTVKQDPSVAVENPYMPLLIVAVQGTKKVVDFIVNANDESKDTRDLFVS